MPAHVPAPRPTGPTGPTAAAGAAGTVTATMTTSSESTSPSSDAYGAGVRTRREARGLSIDQLAELTGIARDVLEDLESGAPPQMYRAITVDSVLGGPGLYDTLETSGTLDPGSGADAVRNPVRELDAAAADLGCWRGQAPMLRWAHTLYELDRRISHAVTWAARPVRSGSAQTNPPAPDASPAGEGDVLVPGTALGTVTLPALEDPRRRPRTTGRRRTLLRAEDLDLDYPADGAVLAGLLREHLQVSPGSPIDLMDACAQLGIAVAGRPAEDGAWVKAVTLRVAGTALVVLNTRFHETVTMLALGHALGHLLAGDVVGPGVVDTVEDADDDSIHSCHGVSPDACWRANAFASEALTPLAYLQAASENIFSGRDRGSVDWAVRRVQSLANDLSVPPLTVAGRLETARLVTPSMARTLQLVLRRRAPFGGAARQGDRWAVHSEDFALPDGPGETWMPAALLDRAVAAALCDDVFFTAPDLVLTDPGLTPQVRAHLAGVREPVWDDDFDGDARRAGRRAALVERAAELATGHPTAP